MCWIDKLVICEPRRTPGVRRYALIGASLLALSSCGVNRSNEGDLMVQKAYNEGRIADHVGGSVRGYADLGVPDRAGSKVLSSLRLEVSAIRASLIDQERRTG